MTTPPARNLSQRTRDTLYRLENDIDLWVATADPESGAPYLVPLSFHWDGEIILLATAAASPTGRNLEATGQTRLALGATRDVVLIEGAVARCVPTEEMPDDVGDAFSERTGFDPRRSASPFLYFEIRPRRIQAWREENELADRLLMRDGEWLDVVASSR